MTQNLAIDIGGTKTLVALVTLAEVVDSREFPTPRDTNARHWCDAIAAAAEPWRGAYGAVGAAVTGLVADGRWSAVNSATLPVPPDFPLQAELAARLGKPVACVNDAHAACWGEYRHGAHGARDLFFLTISTGIGGGAVVDGRLLTGRGGLAASAGLTRMGALSLPGRVEDHCAGRWIADAARKSGHDCGTEGVFAAAGRGEAWATALLAQSADTVANLLVNLQLLFDPQVVVVGGGVGLAKGYAGLLQQRLALHPAPEQPDIRLAALGKYAGVIGAADLAQTLFNTQGG